MIEKLTVHNFQSWKDVTVEFHPHVNVFVGSSDSGKTALISRALCWIAFNRPSGDAFRRWNTKDTHAELTFDGMSIARSKGKSPSDNQYRLSTMENPLTGFGQSVPANIDIALNLTDINVQKQLDAPFLISLPGPDISRKLNELAKLEVIDTTFSNMNSMVRQNNLDITVAQSEQARVQEKLIAYADLGDMEIDLRNIEALTEAIECLSREEADIGTVINQMQAAELALSRIGDPTDGLRIVDRLAVVQKCLSGIDETDSRLSSMMNNLIMNQQIIDRLPDTSDAEAELGAIQIIAVEVKGLEDGEFKLAGLIRSFEGLWTTQCNLESELRRLETKFHAEMPDVCPLCEQEIAR